jgi:hypothetical protein
VAATSAVSSGTVAQPNRAKVTAGGKLIFEDPQIPAAKNLERADKLSYTLFDTEWDHPLKSAI